MKDTIPCIYCEKPTIYTATKLCHNCWEVEARLWLFLRSKRGREYTRTLLNKCKEK